MPRRPPPFRPRSRRRRPSNRRSMNPQSKLTNPSASTVMYLGPIRPLPQKFGLDDNTSELTLTSVCTSTAGGQITTVISSDPTGAQDWANFQAIWDEYRVLALSLQYVPNQIGGNVAAVAYSPIYTAGTHANGTAFTSYQDAAQVSTGQQHYLNQPWRQSIRMSSPEEASWTITSSAQGFAFMYVKVFAANLGNAVNYGQYISRWLVQFRARN